MRKIKYILFILLMLITFNVKAENTCEKDELNRLKELAKKVQFDYDYDIVDGQAKFYIKAVNLNQDLKVLIIEDYYNDKYKEFVDNSTHTATINNFHSGEKVVITIKGFVPNWCSGKTLLTKTIKLPYYNYYYSYEKCFGYEDFKYCKPLINENINQTQFDKQFETYLIEKGMAKEEVVIVETNWKLIIIIGSIVIVLAILVGIISLIVKRRKKNSL